jgi:hypothetical protein
MDDWERLKKGEPYVLKKTSTKGRGQSGRNRPNKQKQTTVAEFVDDGTTPTELGLLKQSVASLFPDSSTQVRRGRNRRRSLMSRPTEPSTTISDEEMASIDEQYATQQMEERARELASTFTRVRGFKSDKATLDRIKTSLEKSNESDALISLVLSYLEGTEYGSSIEA